MPGAAPDGAEQKKRLLRWWSVLGSVQLEEVVLRTKAVHSLRPFAHAVGVHGRGKSARLQRVLADFGIEAAFAPANQRLREHYADGRLTSDELDERITATLSAKTYGELRAVMTDLPEPQPVGATP